MKARASAVLVLAVAILGVGCGDDAQQADGRPNIILIMADDMGFSDIGSYGSEIPTPNLDRLADDGMRFTQFYNNARCSPTRASLLTGRYPHRTGIGAMSNRRNLPKPPAYQGYLNEESITIAEALAAAGYRTMMSGKWHVGERRPHWPLDRGFDDYWGLIGGASSYFDSTFVEPGTDKVRTMADGNTVIEGRGPDFYMTDAISNHAVAQIREAGKGFEPFFQYVAYTAPHWPMHALEEDIALFDDGRYEAGWDEIRDARHARLVELGLIDSEWQPAPRDPRVPAWEDAENHRWQARRMAVFAAMIHAMDRGIGRIMTALDEIGANENTVVFFLADNGGCAEDLRGDDPAILPGGPDSYQGYGMAWANVSNAPFRRYKWDPYEGGIGTPMIVRWPGAVTPGSVTDQVGHIMDILPTAAEIAGASAPSDVDGLSLGPILRGDDRESHEALFWEHYDSRAVRQGQWKAIWDRDLQKWELYDMVADRTESTDLATAQPELLEELAASWQAWAEEVRVWPKELDEGGLQQ